MGNNMSDIVNNQPDTTGNDLVSDTIAFWKNHSGVELYCEEAREMIVNISGFFKLLDRWDLSNRG